MNYRIQLNVSLKSEIDTGNSGNEENHDDIIGKELPKRLKRIFWVGYAIFAFIAFLTMFIEFDLPGHKHASFTNKSQAKKVALEIRPKK